MLCKSALVACLATSFLLGDGLTTSDDVAVADGSAAAVSFAVEPAAEPAPAQPAGVRGKVLFKGKVPPAINIDMASDPYCVGQHADGVSNQHVKVDAGGGLADAFVSLTGVPDERYEAPETPVLLDQHGCNYTPHVFGIMKKQDITILNSDDTLHNIHAVPKKNKEFNVGMPEKGMEITKTFKKDEDAIFIKCDVHPWMAAYCFSMEHPYFGVTGADGSVSIDASGLPDGEYGVRIWHETLGEATATVKVAGGAASFEHTYK